MPDRKRLVRFLVMLTPENAIVQLNAELDDGSVLKFTVTFDQMRGIVDLLDKTLSSEAIADETILTGHPLSLHARWIRDHL